MLTSQCLLQIQRHSAGPLCEPRASGFDSARGRRDSRTRGEPLLLGLQMKQSLIDMCLILQRRGIIASGPFDMGEASGSTGQGQLPTMIECIVALTKVRTLLSVKGEGIYIKHNPQELLNNLPTLVKSQTGSYIVRALLLVLAGKQLPFDSQSSQQQGSRQSAMSRSKKSARWKASRGGAGEMRSFVNSSENGNDPSGAVFGKGKAPERRIVPKIFEECLNDLVKALDVTLSGGNRMVNSEIAQQSMRMASDDPIATGLVQIMLEIENDQGRSEKQGSLMDRLLQGLITAQCEFNNSDVGHAHIYSLTYLYTQ